MKKSPKLTENYQLKKSRISMSEIIKNGHNEIKNKYYLGRIKRDLTNFFKWMALAILTGVVVGGASSVFAICIRWVTTFRADNKWMFLLLPVAGFDYRFYVPKIGQKRWRNQSGSFNH